jgi:hypothetical protein
MNILLCLLLVLLIGVTTGTHVYFVWKRRDYKTLVVQISLIGLAVITGILVIYDLRDPSISEMLNTVSPFKK